MLIDSHCHLDFPDFEQDFDGVLARAREAGVIRFISISTKLRELNKIAKVSAKGNDIYYSIGVHPCEVHIEGTPSSEHLIALSGGDKAVAFGETGLDYYHNPETKDLQRESFLNHIRASQTTGLPLIVHTRDAEEDTYDILQSAIKEQFFPCILHCFTGSMQFAQQCLALGFTISFSGIVTFKNATSLHDIAKYVPINRMLVETDAPYLAPTPMRGKRNEPAFVKHTAQYIADLKGIPYDDFCATLAKNFFELFKKVPQV